MACVVGKSVTSGTTWLSFNTDSTTCNYLLTSYFSSLWLSLFIYKIWLITFSVSYIVKNARTFPRRVYSINKCYYYQRNWKGNLSAAITKKQKVVNLAINLEFFIYSYIYLYLCSLLLLAFQTVHLLSYFFYQMYNLYNFFLWKVIGS